MYTNIKMNFEKNETLQALQHIKQMAISVLQAEGGNEII